MSQMLLHVRTLHASAFKGSSTVVGLEWTSRCCDKYAWSLILPVASEANIYFVTFTDFLSLTNCAIQIPSSKVMAPDRGANTALSSSLKGFAQEV